jgi:hypothetical protein
MNEPYLKVALDYRTEPYAAAAQPRVLGVTLTNPGAQNLDLRVTLAGLPHGWGVTGLPAQAFSLPPAGTRAFDFAVLPTSVEEEPTRLRLEVVGAAKPIVMPLTLMAREGPTENDLALASKGALASSDGELEREKGCTPRAIDGIIAGPDDFEAKRWHSALDTPHPHWVQVKLPNRAKIGRVVIRFADPAGRPVDFKGLALAPDGRTWRELFAVKDYADPRKFRRDIQSVETDTFRLVIEKSVNPVSLNAAQISEIELYPPLK